MNSKEITKKAKSNFAWAFVGLKRPERQALLALYAFCRTVDDIVDEAKNISSAERELGRWRDVLGRISRPSVFDSPVANELSLACSRFPIMTEDLQWIVEGVHSDLIKKRYATFDELITYCDGVASAVGFASMAIFGADRERTAAYTFATGRALQLTNILRDVGADARLGRIYLPAEDLDRFGYREKDVLRSVYNDAFLELMRFERKRVETFYRSAEESLPAAERKRYPAAELMRRIYHALLDKIDAKKYRVFGDKIRISKIRKLSTAFTIWGAYFLSGRSKAPR